MPAVSRSCRVPCPARRILCAGGPGRARISRTRSPRPEAEFEPTVGAVPRPMAASRCTARRVHPRTASTVRRGPRHGWREPQTPPRATCICVSAVPLDWTHHATMHHTTAPATAETLLAKWRANIGNTQGSAVWAAQRHLSLLLQCKSSKRQSYVADIRCVSSRDFHVVYVERKCALRTSTSRS